MLSLLGKTFKQLFFGITLKLNSLSNHGSNFSLSISNRGSFISICIGNCFSSFSLSLFNDLSFDQSSLRYNFIVRQICLSVNGVDVGFSSSFPITSNLARIRFDTFNFFSFRELLESSFLILIFPFLFLDLLGFLFFFWIVFNSLFKSKLLSFKCIFELENSLFLHRISDFLMKNNVGDDDSFNIDTLVIQVDIQLSEHTTGILLSSKTICFLCSHCSCQRSHSFCDVWFNYFIYLRNVCHQLLYILVFWGNAQKNWKTNANLDVISCQNMVVWALINEILFRNKILRFGKWSTCIHSCISIAIKSTWSHHNCNGTLRTIY